MIRKLYQTAEYYDQSITPIGRLSRVTLLLPTEAALSHIPDSKYQQLSGKLLSDVSLW